MRDVYIDMNDLSKGFYAEKDTTKAPKGSARIMTNMRITDRGGIAPRLGTQVLGTEVESAFPVRNTFTFKKSLGIDEIILKPYDTIIKAYSKTYPTAGWWTLKTGLTSDKEFGFVASLVNEDNQDYCVFCNRYDQYMRWTGELAQLTSALVGGETSIPVDSTIDPNIFYAGTATSSSATTVTVSTEAWATSQWVNFYVYITSGVHSGKVRKITANSGTVLTFDTLGSDPVTPTFEIRRLRFTATGTIIYGGTEIAYTGIDTATSFTVASAHAAPDNSIVAQAVEKIEGAPRGNRMTNYLGRIVVGNVRSGLSRDSGGALQGSSSAGSYFVSKLSENDDFSFAAIRTAGDGDLVSTPYGGGDITDVQHQEDTFYVFKQRYIEAVKYSQDENDLAVREPLKQGLGSINRVVKGGDDIYFMTPDKQITTIGRVSSKDLKPQTENIGTPIKRFLDTCEVTNFNGIEDGTRQYFCMKSSDESDENDITLVYNRVTKSFEGAWNISANAYTKFNNDSELYYADALSPNIYRMNIPSVHADISGTSRYPIIAEYASHYMNLTSSKGHLQSLNSMYFEGYIRLGSTITFNIYKDFADDPFLTFDFTGEEEGVLDGSELVASLGTAAFGLTPLGAIEAGGDQEGRRHFFFRVYFPYQQANYFSVGWRSDEADTDYEITRYGLGLAEDVSMKNAVKSV